MTPAPETFSRPRDLPLARGRLLLIGTGAFGVTQLPQWIVALRRWYGVDVRTSVTHSAVRLVAPGALAVASGHAVAGPDWDTSTGRVPHRDLASWPDLVIVDPRDDRLHRQAGPRSARQPRPGLRHGHVRARGGRAVPP